MTSIFGCDLLGGMKCKPSRKTQKPITVYMLVSPTGKQYPDTIARTRSESWWEFGGFNIVSEHVEFWDFSPFADESRSEAARIGWKIKRFKLVEDE